MSLTGALLFSPGYSCRRRMVDNVTEEEKNAPLAC